MLQLKRLSSVNSTASIDTMTGAADDIINNAYNKNYQDMIQTNSNDRGNNLDDISEEYECEEDDSDLNDSDASTQAFSNSTNDPYTNRKKMYDGYTYESVNDMKELENKLYHPKNVSRLAKLLQTAGADENWEMLVSDGSDGSAALLMSEEDEIRLAYQRAQILMEDKIIDKQIHAIKLQKDSNS